MSISNITQYTPNVNIFYEHLTFGCINVILNSMIIVVLVRNRQLMKKSAFMAGLATSDTINGLGLFISACVRINRIKHEEISEPVLPIFCIQQFTALLLLDQQIHGMLFFLIGVERFIAVRYFSWYRVHWNYKGAWILTLAAYVCSLCSITFGILGTIFQPVEFYVTKLCITTSVVGEFYAIYHYCVPLIGGTAAVIMTLMAMILFNKRKKKMQQVYNNTQSNNYTHQAIKKEWQMSRLIFVTSILDLGLIVAPSVLGMLSISKVIRDINTTRIFIVQTLNCFRGIMNIFVELFLNLEFRSAMYKMFRPTNDNTIHVANVNVL